MDILKIELQLDCFLFNLMKMILVNNLQSADLSWSWVEHQETSVL